MDSFEAVVAAILQRRGYWTQTSVKIDLTKEEKKAVGRPSSPRWELDVVGYMGATNQLTVVECKSFLDSPGVPCATFENRNLKDQTRYKLFFDDTLRETVRGRLLQQFVQHGFCAENPEITFALAAGKVKGDEEVLRGCLARKGWSYSARRQYERSFDPSEIRVMRTRSRRWWPNYFCAGPLNESGS
jgi:hypothetical protein